MLNQSFCRSFTLVAFVSFVLVGCQTTGEDTTPGLKGIDADRNGIRDDIDLMITQKYSATPAQRDVAKRLARAMQGYLESTNRTEAFNNYRPISKALSCMYIKLQGDEAFRRNMMLKDIESMTSNTRERFKQYWNVNRMMSGATIDINNDGPCDDLVDAS